jgi:microcystin degradation protein MlrC
VDASKEAEKHPGVLAVSIPGGYQYGDVPAMGPSVIVITDNDPALAKREAERLAAMLWGIRDQLKFDLPDPAKAVRMAMESKAFPVTLLDTGDNVGYPCGGDTQIHVYLSPNAGTAKFTIAGFEVDDIESVVAQLTAQGVTFEQYDQPPIVTDAQGIAHFEGDAKVAYFKDPDGNILSLAQAPK